MIHPVLPIEILHAFACLVFCVLLPAVWIVLVIRRWISGANVWTFILTLLVLCGTAVLFWEVWNQVGEFRFIHYGVPFDPFTKHGLTPDILFNNMKNAGLPVLSSTEWGFLILDILFTGLLCWHERQGREYAREYPRPLV